MNIVSAIRFLYGYVEFETYGGFTQRFINLAAMKNLNIWKLENIDKTMHGFITQRQYKKLEEIAKKSGMDIKKIKTIGLPFVVQNNKHRVGLVIGAVFFAVFSAITSQFIFSIQIEDSETISTQQVVDYLSEIGFGVGSFKYNVDTTSLTRLSLYEFAYELSWMAINISGSSASVELRDYVRQREDESFTNVSNIVADFDGIILSADIYSGEKNCLVGSAVTAGDILISGAVQNSDFSFSYFESSGKITAIHNTNITQTYSYSATTQILSEEKTIYSICFLGLEIPLGFIFSNEEYIEYEDYSYLCYENVTVPFGIKKTVYVALNSVNNNSDFNTTMAVNEFTLQCYNEHLATTILQENIQLQTKNNETEISADFECIDFIGVSEEIEIF